MISKKWLKKLFEETKIWVSEGIIDASQRERITARYSERVEYSRLTNTIITLGSILIGLGILLFVASNWDKLGGAAKISIIFSVIILFNLLGYYFRYVKNEYHGLGEGFILIGAFAFGAGIWLIVQIYQIHYNFSAGILFWILGILPIAYLYRSWPILSLSSILSLIWLISYQTYYLQREAYGFLVLLSVLVTLGYLLKQRFSLFVMIVAFSIWLWIFWDLKYPRRIDILEDLSADILFVAIYMFLGFILYGLGIWHSDRGRFAWFTFLYKFLGMLFISSGAYLLTFAHHHKGGNIKFCPPAIWILMATLLILAFLVFSRLLRLVQEKTDLQETKMMLYFLTFAILSVWVSFVFSRFPKLASISFNLFLVAMALGFMYLGFLKRSEGIFRLAIVIFFINVLSRYFDIFWKMLPRSLLFILGGILMIAGAIFADRKRREIENRMHKA